MPVPHRPLSTDCLRHLPRLALMVALASLGGCTQRGPTTPDPASYPPPEPGIVEAGGTDGEADDKKAPDWDVMNPPGLDGELGSDVTIDTQEGTWMSLDVSPDGQTLAFDLLGDLYTLPIAGGEAKSLTTGVAWDMQPRWSPDGKWIAFTSDRGGGDNIWVVRNDGSDPRPVTKETFRLLNSPVWSPDSRFIAARKHFTKHRSLGAGEIWLYHVTGGDGVPLTEKQNDQKDVGEPAISPDGRFVYFSQDTTPGKYFEYNKDPNPGIYSIKRLDRETGELETYLSGAGGAIRPTPSPDGKTLAFVRRVRTKTVLFVHDIESGAERALYHDLDRDMQEAWAIHGVYPTMAWTPDNRSIVFWAGGKIHRVDAQTGQAREIPFHVKTTRRVAKAMRRAVEVAPATVDVKLMRWTEVSPDGKSVVFQALGHLYIRDLSPTGQQQPRRLTSQTEHYEFYPRFSPDGKSIVYTTWDDTELGSVRVVSVRNGRSRVVTTQPGHYIEPTFSPDGKQVAYQKVGGGWVRSPKWSRDRGLYIAPVKPRRGQQPTRVTPEGDDPQFSGDGTRLYFTVSGEDKGGEDRVALESIELDGSDRRVHVESSLASAYRVSPDGRWLAFVEGFQAHILPMPATGSKPIKVGPKATSLPIARVTRDAGTFVHWSGDSQTLHWSHGPELFSRALKDAFAFLQGAPKTLPEPPEKGINLGLSVPADVPKGTVAIVGARVATMRRDAWNEVLDDATILVQGNRIQAIGPRAQVAVPAGAHVISGAGMTVMPGLVDVHAHGAQGRQGIIPEQNWLHYAELAFGVTTVHDPSNDTHTIFAASEMARAGMLTAPRIFSTGTILYGALAPFKADVDSLDDARSHLRRMKQVGAFSVKSYNQPRRNQRQQVMAAARELGVMVVPEGGSLFHHNMTMVVDGHTGVEHCIPVGAAYSDVFQLWGQTEVGYTPTLGVAYGGLGGENYWYAHTNVWEDKRLLSFVPRFAVDPPSRRRTMAPDDDWNHMRAAKIAKQLLDAGGKVQLGAHGQREGLAAHWELWMFVQGGMTPHEALRAGTLHGAQYLGLDADVGSLEVGKLADLVILNQDPLVDIRNSTSIVYTMVNGRVYDAATMDEVGNRPQKRGPFFFEENPDLPTTAPPPEAVCHGHL